MVYITNKRHPRQRDEAGEMKPFEFCATDLGCHTCIKSQRKSDFSDFGIGITLYFKMIKYLIYLFLILSMLSVPVFIIYWSGNETEIQFTSKQALSSFTLGNIGESEQICNSYFYTKPNRFGEAEEEIDEGMGGVTDPMPDPPTDPLPGNLKVRFQETEPDPTFVADNHIELFCSYGFLTDLQVFGLEVEGESSCNTQDDDAD